MPELDTAIKGVGALSMPGQFTGAVADQYMNPYYRYCFRQAEDRPRYEILTEQVQLEQQTQ